MEIIKNIKNDIILFFIFFLSCSFGVSNDIISSKATILLWIVLGIVIIGKRIRVDKTAASFWVVSFLAMWTSVLLNEPGSYYKYLCISFSMIVIFLYTQHFNIHEFIDSYCRVFYILALISLILYSLFLLYPRLNNYFLVYSRAGTQFSYLYIFVKSPHSIRNCGMFWEPGAYQTFLIISLMFEIRKEQLKVNRLLVLVIAIITTFSTTGYIALAILLFFTVYKMPKLNWKYKILFILLIIGSVYFFLNADLIIRKYSGYSVFGKINEIMEIDAKSDSGESTSGSIRFYAVFKPIEVFVSNPLFGVGYNNLNDMLRNYTYNMNTCTFSNFFAVHGIIFGSIYLYGFFYFSRKISKNYIELISAIIIFFVATMSENYISIACIYLFPYFGFNIIKKEKPKRSITDENCVN